MLSVRLSEGQNLVMVRQDKRHYVIAKINRRIKKNG